MKYDVIIIGAGPGGIFSAYELILKNPKLKVAVFESGHALSNRKCPIDGEKFYNMEVEVNEKLESCHKGLYIIGDGSGITHSLSHASASGVYVARNIIEGN